MVSIRAARDSRESGRFSCVWSDIRQDARPRKAGLLALTGMTSGEIKEFLQQRPFVPFRLFMVDGMGYDVRRAGQALVTKYMVVVGIDLDETGTPERTTFVDPRLVTRVEFDKVPDEPGGNGRA
jgi:hypothetical protein